MITEILLPTLPPSTNSLYRNWTDKEKARGRHLARKGRPKSERYNTWLNAAGWDLKLQKPGKHAGKVRLSIWISEKGKTDLSNNTKALEDLLVTHQVIVDDGPQYVREIRLAWDEIPGVRIRIEDYDLPHP